MHDARGDWAGRASSASPPTARPFALLAVEVDDAPRLVAADADAAAGALARVEQAVRGELRPGDVLGPRGRRAPVDRRRRARRRRARARWPSAWPTRSPPSAPLRGAPLTVSIGAAASPADGTDREALAARADESLYAARAAGVPMA